MSEYGEARFNGEIVAETVEEHKDKVKDALQRVEFMYIDKLVVSGKASGRTFSEVLRRIDKHVESDLMSLSDLENAASDGGKADAYFSKIDEAYDAAEEGRKAEAAAAAVKGLYVLWQKNFPDDYKARFERDGNRESEKAGILQFNVRKAEGITDDPVKERERLDGMGLAPDDACLEIHLPEAYLSGDRLRHGAIKDSLARIAEIIVDRHPEARGVVGLSWLLDRPAVRKLLGFEEIGESSPNWLQFIDEKGQIKPDLVEEMAKSGELPHRNIAGAAKTEDFLRRFLPKERRGEIELKEIDPDWREKYGGLRRKIRAEGERFAADWDGGKIADEPALDEAFEEMPNFTAALRASGAFEEWRGLLVSNFGHTRKELFASNRDCVEALTAKMEAYYDAVSNPVYRSRKVVIE